MAKVKENNGYQKQTTLEQKRKSFGKSSLISGIIISIMIIYIGCSVEAYRSIFITAGYGEAFTGWGEILSKNPVQGLMYFWPVDYNISMPFGIAFIVAMFSVVSYEYGRLRLGHDVNTLKGSSVWANAREVSLRLAEVLKGGDYRNHWGNVIASENVFISANARKADKPLNFLIVGTSGSGKSRYFLKPNILQMNTSYVVTDPKGELLDSMGEVLRRNGYNVRVFDVLSLKNCNTYNPLKYCYQESDIRKIIETFMKNVNPDAKGGGSQDPFWDDSTRMFLSACVGFLVQKPLATDNLPEGSIPYAQIPEITGGVGYTPCFATLCEFVRMAGKKWKPYKNADTGIVEGLRPLAGEIKEDKNAPQKTSEVGVLFENVRYYEAKRQGVDIDRIVKPYCLREWENFYGTPEKTATTIMTTAATKLDAFNIEQVKNLTSGDEYGNDNICLEDFGKKKDALFLIIPPTDKTYNFLVSFLYTQLFDLLYKLGSVGTKGSKILKLQNGELVRFFEPSLVGTLNKDGKDYITAKVEAIRNSTAVYNIGGGQKHGTQTVTKKTFLGEKKVEEKVTIDDGWYDIYDADGELVSRRSNKKMADDYLADLKNAKLMNGNPPAIPYHCRFLMDEFPNIGEVPDFLEKLSTMRGYEISSTIICQDITQLKKMYEHDYQTMDTNCPYFIYLGGDGQETTEYVSKKLGDATVVGTNNSVDAGNGKINSSKNVDARNLMKPEEIGRMDKKNTLVIITGEQPVIDKKFDYIKHRNYKLCYDFASYAGTDAIAFDRGVYEQPYATPLVWEKEAATPTANVLSVTMDSLKRLLLGSAKKKEDVNAMTDQMMEDLVENAEYAQTLPPPQPVIRYGLDTNETEAVDFG